MIGALHNTVSRLCRLHLQQTFQQHRAVVISITYNYDDHISPVSTALRAVAAQYPCPFHPCTEPVEVYDSHCNTITATHPHPPKTTDIKEKHSIAPSQPETADNPTYNYVTLSPKTDLHYYGYRYYNPGMGRWITRDPQNEIGALSVIYKDVLADLRQKRIISKISMTKRRNQWAQNSSEFRDYFIQEFGIRNSFLSGILSAPNILNAIMKIDHNLYLFVVNNPVFFVDVDGRKWWPPWKWPFWPKRKHPQPPEPPRDRECERIQEINRKMHASCYSVRDLSDDDIDTLPLPESTKQKIRNAKCSRCTICAGCEFEDNPTDPTVKVPTIMVGCSFAF